MPKVQGLSGFGLLVPDLGEAEKFYGTFGLQARNLSGALLLGSAGRNHAECVLRQGAEKRLHHVSFFIRPEDRIRFADTLAAAGLEVEEAPEGWVRPGVWFRDPWGTWIHLDPSTPSPPRSRPNRRRTSTAAPIASTCTCGWRSSGTGCPCASATC